MALKYGKVDPSNNYGEYSRLMGVIGLSPLSQDEFYKKYSKGGDFSDIDSGAWGGEIANLLVSKINESKKQMHDWNPSIPFTAYNGATGVDALKDIESAYTRTLAETSANKPKNVNPDGSVNDNIDPTTGKEKYVFKPTEIMKQAEESYQKEAGFMKNPNYKAGGTENEWIADPSYVEAERPVYSYDPSLSNKYFTQLSEAEKAGTDEAVKKVNETANFINPYATGSGSQVKAVADMMDEITANRQARAFALGTNEYDRNYTGQYADYEKKLAKKSNAMNSLLNLSTYYTTMANEATNRNEANYWKNLGIQNEYNLMNLNTEAEDKRYQRDTELMAKAVELNRPQEKNWWEPFIGAAVGGLTGGLGYGLTTGTANLMSGQKWGYNPYAELLKNYSGK
jgi:hypothetical protein